MNKLILTVSSVGTVCGILGVVGTLLLHSYGASAFILVCTGVNFYSALAAYDKITKEN